MTDPSTPDRPGGNTPNDQPNVPSWGAPPPPPAPQQPGQSRPGTYDAPPSPPSAYPSPQQGGFPPPPQGGFPPPPAGYGPGAGYTPPSSDIGAAFTWGWEKFKQNAVALIVSILLWAVVIGAIAGIGVAIAGAVAGTTTTARTDAGITAATSFGIVGIIIVGILAMLASFISTIALANGYLAIADGGRASIGDFFKFRNVGQGLLLALLLGVASGLVSWTGIGSLAIAFFGSYAIYFVVDRGLGAIDAIKASVKLAIDNAAVTIVALLVSGAGVIACGVGVLVTYPLATLVLVHVYRRATGGRVAA